MVAGTSWLDVKLGLRVLVRYPVLTIVGGLAIAVAIGIGAAYFEFVHDVVSPTLPLAEGDRVVGIQNWDAAASRPESRTLHDFAAWRAQVRSIRDLGAFATVQRNLVTDDGRSEPMSVAEITASAFRAARVPALLGRPLLDADEQQGAPPVAVIGHDLWQARFAGDAGVIGRPVQLGATRATIVGVMPEDFAFPLQHRLWVPLSVSVGGLPRLEGPSIRVFGRLAPGVTLEQAQAELTGIGLRSAAEFPETHEHLRPRIVPYTYLFVPNEMRWQLYLLGSVFVMFLVVACANVATLVFARTATRNGEIAVRHALGATRGRIVAQLFVEALVLSSAAALVGLGAAWWGLERVVGAFWSVQGPDSRPFWWSDEISGATLFYAALLTVIGAAIAGGLPALKVTGSRMPSGLTQAGARGSSLRFGGVWTVVIVTQVAITVAFLPTAISEAREAVRYGAGGTGVAAEQFLAARLEMDSGLGAPGAASNKHDTRFATAYRELVRRLASEPGVTAVTFADRLPGMEHPARRVEVEAVAQPGNAAGGLQVREALVDVGFFGASGARVVPGRDFHSGDLASGQTVVIVNRSFVQQVLGGRNPLGQRVRHAAAAGKEPGAWHEIVGMVDDLGMNPANSAEAAGMYRPVAPERAAPLRIAVRVANGPELLAPRLRSIAAAVDPMLRLYEVQSLDDVGRADQVGNRLVASVLGVVALIALLLSTVGVYSLISFTVSQRTREIGIRVALGADPVRILVDIFSRVFAQLAMGVAAGGAFAALLLFAGLGDQMSREGPALLLTIAALMLVMGILACVTPARRVLRVQPSQTLNDA